MILVRPYEAKDFKAVQELHQRQGLGYDAPRWGKALVGALLEIDGRLVMAGFLRQTAETYLLMDPQDDFRKRERLGQLLIMHKEMIPAARRKGLEDVHCWLPPQLEGFGKLLTNEVLGWEPAPWPTCYSLKVST